MELAESIGLSIVASRDPSNPGNPQLEEGDAVLNTFNNVQLILGASTDQGIGKLFITETDIIWLSDDETKKGYAAPFTSISMHAIAKNDEDGPKPYLYVQLAEDDDLDESNRNEEQLLPELQIIPADTAQLEAIFQAFCDGAVRNPDVDIEEEGQGNLFFDHEEALAGAVEGLEVEELVGDDPSRFDDPEEDEEEEDEQPANGKV